MQINNQTNKDTKHILSTQDKAKNAHSETHTQLINRIIKNVFSLPIVFLFKLGVEIWME